MRLYILAIAFICSFMSSAKGQNKALASDFINPDVEVGKISSLACITLLNTASVSTKAEGLIAEDLASSTIKFIPTSGTIHTGSKLDRASLKKYLEATKAKHVLVIKLMTLGVKKNEVKVPVYLNDNAKDPRFINESSRRTKSDNFYSDLYPSYQLTGKSNNWQSAKQVRVQLTIVEIESATTIWSGFSQYVKPKKFEVILPQLFDEATESLKQKKVI